MLPFWTTLPVSGPNRVVPMRLPAKPRYARVAAAVTFVVLLSIGAGWRHAEPARDVVPVA